MKLFHELFSPFLLPILGLYLDDGAGGGGGGAGAGAAGGGGDAGGAGGAAGAGGGAAGAGTPAQMSVLIGPDGKFVKGWSGALGVPDTLEAKFTDPKALAGSYVNLEKMINAKGIIPPGPNATAEEKSAFFKALGRPDKPEDYGITMPAKIGDKAFPKELWNADQAAGFAKWAHEKGFNKEQVAALVEFDAARGLSTFEAGQAAQTKAKTDGIAALKTEWGADYDKNLALATKAAEQAGGADLMNHPLANDPVFIKAMAKVGAMIVEDSAAGARGTQHTNTNPAAEIAAIMADKKHAWQPDFAKHGHSAQAHQAAVEQMAKLYRLKNGEAA